MEPLMILASQLKPSPEEMAFFPELMILHSQDLTPEDVELIETLHQSKLFIIQFVIGPVKITKDALLPALDHTLSFARPKQSFERFGPLNLPLDEDISHDQALIVIENDENYSRVDKL